MGSDFLAMKSKRKMEQFSIYKEITATVPSGEIGIEELMEIMTSDVLKGLTDQVRASDDLRKAKRVLPNITVNGTFSQRGNNFLMEYGQLTAIDFDHIPAELLDPLWTFLSENPGTHFMFISPSGSGIKLIIRHNNIDPNLHWNMYSQIIKYYREVLKIPYIDDCVKDLSRATYICYNSTKPFYNPKSGVFQFKFDPSLLPSANPVKVSPAVLDAGEPMTAKMKEANTEFQKTWKDKALMDYIDKYQWSKFPEDYKPGNRNDSLVKKATQLCLCGVDYDLALWKLKFFYGRAGVSDEDIEERVAYAYRKNQAEFGTIRKKWEERRDEGIRKWKSR